MFSDLIVGIAFVAIFVVQAWRIRHLENANMDIIRHAEALLKADQDLRATDEQLTALNRELISILRAVYPDCAPEDPAPSTGTPTVPDVAFSRGGAP